MGLELLGGVGEGDPGLLASGAEVGAVGCWGWVGEQVVDLAGDVSMLLCFTNRGFGWWPLWVRAGW